MPASPHPPVALHPEPLPDRLGIVSDAHGNAEALALALEVLAARGAEQVLFLGDAVGYLPGRAALDLLRVRGIAAIKGNHEVMVLADEPTEPIYRHAETRAELTASDRDWIGRWPTALRAERDGASLLFVHGSPADPTDGRVYPDTDLEPLGGGAHAAVFMGHTHRPFVRFHAGTQFVNVGSCGLPRDRGDRGAAALWDATTRTAEIVRFDITAATRHAIERVGGVDEQVQAVFARRPDEPDRRAAS